METDLGEMYGIQIEQNLIIIIKNVQIMTKIYPICQSLVSKSQDTIQIALNNHHDVKA